MAGVLRRGAEVHFYVHHNVPGMSMRPDWLRANVTRYRLPVATLRTLTRRAVRGLRGRGVETV